MDFKREVLVKSFTASEQELEKINVFTRRKLSSDEVYVFSVILCDNEIDRDCERFSIDALKTLSEMYIGKTGIFDHNPKGENQAARIFDAQIAQDDSKTTTVGETYTYVLAKAYMVRTEKNRDLILELDAGIKKEVSVGCSIAKSTCSVCGKDLKRSSCGHVKGQIYNSVICHTVLSEPTDAYEWSFVAVPAQINAGVVKGFKQLGKGGNLVTRQVSDIIKQFKEYKQDIVITKEEAAMLSIKIDELEQKAQLGECYRSDLIKQVSKLAFLAKETIDANVLLSVAEKMNIEELKAFKASYEKKAADFSGGIQLGLAKADSNKAENKVFKI